MLTTIIAPGKCEESFAIVVTKDSLHLMTQIGWRKPKLTCKKNEGEHMTKTTAEWWAEVRDDSEKLAHWLRRQYVGELAAVNLLSEMILKFGADMTEQQWEDTHKVMLQEATHAKWMKQLLDARGILPEKDADPTRRYWQEVLPAVDDFQKASAAAHDAERMRLHRIRAIALDQKAPADIRNTFKRILPHEEWHEIVFESMRGDARLDEAHERGLAALSLVLA